MVAPGVDIDFPLGRGDVPVGLRLELLHDPGGRSGFCNVAQRSQARVPLSVP
ncbi:hypothetical protein [Streptomyces luteogriseus]|uniref:hypothetical protein n=1 Tax=Streptomyces luteogriseus TaxID=68233 RepID=UPI0037F4D81E